MAAKASFLYSFILKILFMVYGCKVTKIIRNFAASNQYLTFMQETRQNKIARLLQKELSMIFQEQTRAMHGTMVSVTRVKVSPDLSICTAYLSIFPSERAEELLQNIEKNQKAVRYALGQRVRNQLRIIPELRFFVDDSLDYIDRIDELLKSPTHNPSQNGGE